MKDFRQVVGHAGIVRESRGKAEGGGPKAGPVFSGTNQLFRLDNSIWRGTGILPVTESTGKTPVPRKSEE